MIHRCLPRPTIEQRGGFRQVREPISVGSSTLFGHSIRSHCSGCGRSPVVAMRRPHAPASKRECMSCVPSRQATSPQPPGVARGPTPSPAAADGVYLSAEVSLAAPLHCGAGRKRCGPGGQTEWTTGCPRHIQSQRRKLRAKAVIISIGRVGQHHSTRNIPIHSDETDQAQSPAWSETEHVRERLLFRGAPGH